MKLQDLRIGNYVVYEATTHIVSAIGRSGVYSWWVKDGEPVIEYRLLDADGKQVEDPYFDQISNYEPMPITEEWLLKFGFENWDKNKWVDSNSVLTISKNDDNFLCLINQRDVDILYVHQLQNLYFALTGKELTLKDNL